MIEKSKIYKSFKNKKLIYPTGERILIESRSEVEILLGKFSLKIPMIIAEISDDCILGEDFLKAVNLERIFESYFDSTFFKKKSSCSRINSSEEIPEKLKKLFEENSRELDSNQKNVFAEFLNEFQDIFSEDIVAGNCNVVEHVIELKDPKLIKQAPRRIPIHLRKDVDQIILDMKSQGVIEESKSPWISPVMIVKKKMVSLDFAWIIEN